eukprot:1366030-Pleurochrysis_carterae.AAC.3
MVGRRALAERVADLRNRLCAANVSERAQMVVGVAKEPSEVLTLLRGYLAGRGVASQCAVPDGPHTVYAVDFEVPVNFEPAPVALKLLPDGRSDCPGERARGHAGDPHKHAGAHGGGAAVGITHGCRI